MKFGKEMSREERKENIKQWIEDYKNEKGLNPQPELGLAIGSFEKGNLDSAARYLIKLNQKHLTKIYEHFERFIKNLEIPKNLELEMDIRRSFELKNPKEVISLLNKAVRQNELVLTDEEKEIIKKYGEEYA